MFLNRNLTYMRQRMSRKNKARLSIDVIVDNLRAKKEEELNAVVRTFMTLTFLGFYNKRCKYLIHFF